MYPIKILAKTEKFNAAGVKEQFPTVISINGLGNIILDRNIDVQLPYDNEIEAVENLSIAGLLPVIQGATSDVTGLGKVVVPVEDTVKVLPETANDQQPFAKTEAIPMSAQQAKPKTKARPKNQPQNLVEDNDTIHP